jgi:MoaA/NifB/PqqE/SkfB family radical SAM enzyme
VKWAAYEAGITHGPFFPDRLYVESTSFCNLHCVMCPTGIGSIRRPKGYMAMDLYQRIVDEVAPQAPAIVLHSWGEPMMHPRLFDISATRASVTSGSRPRPTSRSSTRSGRGAPSTPA